MPHQVPSLNQCSNCAAQKKSCSQWFCTANKTTNLGQCGGAIASFPGSSAPKCEHWSCAGRKTLVFFLTWATSGAERLWLCVGVPRSSEQEMSEGSVTCYTYLAFRGWISHTPRIECIVGWTMCNTFTFCYTNSGHFSIPSCSHEKRYQVLPGYTCSCYRVGKPGNEERGATWAEHSLFLPTYSITVSHFPAMYVFRGLTSKLYFSKGLRPKSLPTTRLVMDALRVFSL